MTGAIVWFTGVPASGKSTLARTVGERVRQSRPVDILDGDDIRKSLSKDLGFSKADRDANIARVGALARARAAEGRFVIVATISPYDTARENVRRLSAEAGIPFALIFLDASLETLAARDVKGHYRQARSGELVNFTGVSDPFERPGRPDVFVSTEHDSVEATTEQILAGLARCGVLPHAE